MRRMLCGILPVFFLGACQPSAEPMERRPATKGPGTPTAGDATTQTPTPTPDSPTGQTPSDVPTTQAVDLVNKATLKSYLDLLAAAQYQGRGSATNGHSQAAQYVVGEMQKAGLTPASGTSFLQPFNVNAGPTNNVVGIFEGNDPTLKQEFVIVGAHLDHLGTTNGTMYPGADDNASGSATVLTLAKAFAAVKSQLKRSVILMAFSGEELGLLGSRYYVQNPLRPLNKTVFMLNMDMIGYGAGKVQIMGIGANDPAGTVLNTLKAKYAKIAIDMPADSGDRSDHAPFRNAGVPIALFHTGLHNNYHQPTDTPDKIDFDTMETIARIAFEMSYYMAMNGQVASFARDFYALKNSPFMDGDDYFTAYFNQHGLGRIPDFDPKEDHATLPGQPL